LPHIEKAYEKYKDDAGVAFLMISIDDDKDRLQRFVAERKWTMPVARLSAEDALRLMGVSDVPAGFYVDRAGVVRYETRGGESHGDSAGRVAWYVEELKQPR
jgi:hypothetical protein